MNEPVRFSQRGPESPRKRSTSFRADNVRRLSRISLEDTDEPSKVAGAVATAAKHLSGGLDDDSSGKSYASAADDFVEVSDEDETEFPEYSEASETIGEREAEQPVISPLRPGTMRGGSFDDDKPTQAPDKDDSSQLVNGKRSKARAYEIRPQSSPVKPGPEEARIEPKRLPPSATVEEEKSIKWEKPDWAKNANLKQTPKGELLKRKGSLSDEKDCL